MNISTKTYLKYYLKGRNAAKRITRFGARKNSYKLNRLKNLSKYGY